MITNIRLTNFQSHKNTLLHLAPGLNVITGPSDSGKTATIRALRWNLYNEPRGDAFVRAGERECEVVVTFDDGAAVIRSRHGKANEYHVVSSSGDEMHYEAFGAEPPPEVAQASGMPKVQVGEREIAANFAFQFDGPFLLSESPLVAAKVLGKLAGTEEVDHAARLTAADTNRRRQEERRLAFDVGQFDRDLAKYADLPETAERIRRLETLVAEIAGNRARLETLTRFRTELAALSARQDELAGRIRTLTKVCCLDDALGCLESGFQRLARLRTLREACSEQARLASLSSQALQTATATLKAEPAVSTAAALRERLTVLSGLAARLAPVARARELHAATIAVLSRVERADVPARLAERAAIRLRILGRFPAALERVDSERKAAALTYEANAPVAAAQPLAQGATTLAARLSALRRLRDGLAVCAADRARVEGRAARLNQVLTAEGLVGEADELRSRCANLAMARSDLRVCRFEGGKLVRDRDIAVQAISTYQESYVSVLVESGTCPVCGSAVDPAKLKEVLKSA